MSTRRGTKGWEAKPRWRVVRSGTIALGPGKVDLLQAIDASGSISSAAKSLGMSYRRAWMLVATMNESFRERVVETSPRRQAGAKLTPTGQQALRLYRRIESRSAAAARRDTTTLLRLLAR